MSEIEPEIHRAARRGDLPTLARLLAEGVDINLRYDVDTEHGSQLRQLTPLMTAARSMDGATEQALAWLVEHGADLHAVSGGKVTAAWYAAGKGGCWWADPWHKVPSHAARLKFLLDAGLNPHEASCTGRSLLSEACFAGDLAAVKLLLERGVSYEPVAGWLDEGNDFHTENHWAGSLEGALQREQIPLFGAVESGSVECVQLLLNYGARIDRVDDYNYDLLDVALSQDHFYTPEYQAPSPRYAVIAKLLLDAGVPLDRINKSGHSRLYWITFCQQLYGVEFLLEQGASLDGYPLKAICFHGPSRYPENPAQERIVRMLVAAGVPFEAPDYTMLQMAIFGDIPNSNIVRVLLELGANPEFHDSDGTGPLHWAVGQHSVESVELLLQYGANPLHPSRSGETPLACAQHQVKEREKIAREEQNWQWVADDARAILALLEAEVGIEQNGDGRR